MPHSIRLRGPWKVKALARAVEQEGGDWELKSDRLQGPVIVQAPADWGEALGGEFRGLVRYSRQFHRPTGLEASSRVWLVIEDVDFQAAVYLNEQPLGVVQLAGSPIVGQVFNLPYTPIPCPARFDITSLLTTSNTLTLEILLPPDTAALPRSSRDALPGGLIGLVRLEIE